MRKNTEPVRGGVARVPLIMQMESMDCGSACLSMVMAYYGKLVSLEQMREDCGVSRDGVNGRTLLINARRYGLEAHGYRVDVGELRRKGLFPCVIHWNLRHFVVLCGFRGKRAYINDPARGRYSVAMDEFDKSFTGLYMSLVPGEDFKRTGRRKSLFSYAYQHLRGAGSAFVLVAVMTMLSSYLVIINSGMSRVFTDRLLTQKNPEWFYPFIAVMTILCGVQITLSWVKAVCSLKVDGKMAIIANSRFMWHILRLPVDFYSQRMTGDVARRKERMCDLSTKLIKTFAPLLIQAFMMIFYLAVILHYSPWLTMIGLIAVALNLAASQFIAYRRENLTRVTMRDKSRLAGETASGVEMIESIKASGAENGFFEKWAGRQASANSGAVRMEKINAYLGIIPNVVSLLANNVVLICGVYLVMNGRWEWTIGLIIAFQGFFSAFTAPAMQLVEATQTLQEMRTDIQRVEDVMEYPTDVEYAEPTSGEPLMKLSGKIEMRNVTFGYSRVDPPLIENFNMTLEPGKSVAFVGSTGCGKTTLAKLILGLYKPWSGEILFDGTPVDRIPRSVFTGSISAVDQEIVLFHDTVANNIRMWDLSITDAAMIQAAKDACIHEDILLRGEGYQRVLSEGGRDMSGGQRQRVEIARALAKKPDILVLDEATSALDAKIESEVMASIRARGVTAVLIAHRLSTVRDCDEIIVMDHGRAAERGTHAELMARNGMYKKLIKNE